MPMTRLRRSSCYAALLWISALFFWLLHYRLLLRFCQLDPDRFFHLRISQILVSAQAFFLSSLPQIEDLGWAKGFPDKEFLFHVLTSIAFRIGGMDGVDTLVPVLAGSIILSLIYIAWKCTGSSVSAGSAVLMAMISHYEGLFRLSLLRPHLLGILFFCWITYAVIQGKPRWLFFFSVLFGLSYHTYYVPLLVIVIGLFFHWRSQGLRLFVLGTLGLFTGLVLNPYFPDNVGMALQHLRIALGRTDLPRTAYGVELIPLRSDKFFLGVFGIDLFLVFLGIAWLASKWRQSRWQAIRSELIILASYGGFVCVAFLSPRAEEYIFPLAALLLAFFLSQWRPSMVACLFLLILIPSGAYWHLYDLNPSANFKELVSDDIRNALAKLPADSTGKKILNCDWAASPEIFFKRPDMRVVDILDPSFLYQKNPVLYQARQALQAGTITDLYAIVDGAFHAQFVLCANGQFASDMGTDANFVRLFPEPGEEATVVLYAVREHRQPPELVNYVVGWHSDAAVHPMQVKPIPVPAENPAAADNEPMNYVDLYDRAPADFFASPDNWRCATIEPTVAEMQKHAGAKLLTIAGGPFVGVWLNKQLLFMSSHPRPAVPAAARTVIRLNSIVNANDQLTAVVCGRGKDSRIGVGLSLWRPHELSELCGLKIQKDLFLGVPTVATDLGGSTCLGSDAVAVSF